VFSNHLFYIGYLCSTLILDYQTGIITGVFVVMFHY